MLDTINVAASGLAASQEQIENVMNNVANENTPGYKKRDVTVSEASHTDARLTGRGVDIGDTTRRTNVYVYDNLTEEKSKQSEYDELSMMLADIEAIFYETDDSGMSADLDRYYQAIEDLRSSPNDEIYKDNVKNQGQVLVEDLKTLYEDIEGREEIASNNVDDYVEEVNKILYDIGDVNSQMSMQAEPSNDLLDKRDQLEQELAQYIDIDINRSYDYELEVGGSTAVRFETNIHNVHVVTENIPQKDEYATVAATTADRDSSLIPPGATFDEGDSFTYKLDNTTSVTVAYGDYITDAAGNNLDLDGDGNDDTVDETNLVNALMYKINNDSTMSSKVTAYNGEYALDSDGNKILTNDLSHPGYANEDHNFDPNEPNKDKYLVIESNVDGDKGQFTGKIIFNDNGVPSQRDKNEVISVEGTDDVHLEIFDEAVDIEDGKLKPLLDNLTTSSEDNLFQSYKDKLDNFAAALSDLSTSYIDVDGEYVYGANAVDVDIHQEDRVDLNLFSGSSVDTLTFNKGVVDGLSQDDLDYLSSIQWKDDIDIDGSGDTTSLSKYYQGTRVKVSNDKENIDFKKETQDAVTDSLQLNYDKLTKVDNDEEMMDLMKYQAAYEANAKIITVIDEMLQTILGMTR